MKKEKSLTEDFSEKMEVFVEEEIGVDSLKVKDD
jgi:hypothetical protein